jgi:ElaB/YqjD/DUF883 family membrane-anchored ribosome-binding protein
MAIDTMDSAQTAARSGNELADTAREAVDTARETVDQVAGRARKKIDEVADTAAGVADRVSSQASDTVTQALRYTATHPLQALGAVLLAGFVIGRLTRR